MLPSSVCGGLCRCAFKWGTSQSIVQCSTLHLSTHCQSSLILLISYQNSQLTVSTVCFPWCKICVVYVSSFISVGLHYTIVLSLFLLGLPATISLFLVHVYVFTQQSQRREKVHEVKHWSLNSAKQQGRKQNEL